MTYRTTPEYLAEIAIIQSVLTVARAAALEAEVLNSAFLILQEEPSLGIKEALRLGLAEWDLERNQSSYRQNTFRILPTSDTRRA